MGVMYGSYVWELCMGVMYGSVSVCLTQRMDERQWHEFCNFT